MKSKEKNSKKAAEERSAKAVKDRLTNWTNSIFKRNGIHPHVFKDKIQGLHQIYPIYFSC